MSVPKFSVVILLVVPAGILMNTSIINLEETGTGVPLFYGVLPLMAIRIVAGRFGQGSGVRLSSDAVLFSWTIVAILSAVTLGHVMLTDNSVEAELKQYGARLAFVLFYALSYLLFVQRGLYRRAINYSKILMKCLIVYGIYQFFADMYGYTRFLDFLRNSASYGLRSLEDSIEQGGWSGTYRATSVWTEPSFSAMPLGFFLYLLFFHTKSKSEKVVWLLVALIYAALTFSRVVWLILAILLLAMWILPTLLAGVRRRRNEQRFRKYKYVVFLCLAGFLSSIWPYYAPFYMTDLSSIGRSGSVIIGWRIFADYPVVGSGFNTYPMLERAYSAGIEYYFSEPIVHNLFSGYAQQMGILGLIYSALPIVFVLSLKNKGTTEAAFLALLFALLGSFAGDTLYMPLTWMVLAIVSVSPREQTVRVAVTDSPDHILINRNVPVGV